MCVSTDAILFYGYCWSEETDLLPRADDGDAPEWDEVILRKRGVHCPFDDYPRLDHLPYREREKKSDAGCVANRQRLDAWYDQRKAVHEEFGVDIDSHCSDSCSMPFVYVDGAGTTASRGYPKTIDPASLTVQAEWKERLDRFLAELGIDKPHEEPCWFLVSYWG